VSLDEWWLLGAARCIVGSGTCGAIVRTTDGGSKFAGIPSPPVSASSVTQLRFANALDGYAFDPELWETTDGGASWAKVATPGQVTELEAADGEAYALVCAAGSADCQSTELLRTRVGSHAWQQVLTPLAPSYGSQFTVSSTNLYVLRGNEHLVLEYSPDEGASFIGRVDPCNAGLGGSLTTAADGSAALFAACPTGTEAQALLSTNAGTTWHSAGGGFPNSLQLTAASSSVALAWPAQDLDGIAPGALERTTNGGKSYSVVLSGSSSSRVSWAGFSDPARAYALVASFNAASSTQLFESTDSGATWRRVVIAS
jgi:photosystem II stability/assembly factor-like uncharacterized protein